MFKSILIANRGEIACRIMRTAKAMGLRTIAVYSTADEYALHVQMADEAYWIGEAEAAASYLDGARILEVANKSGAECIHPGYGFLSENAGFSQACAKAGIAFIGPQTFAIKAMGLKDKAKALMERVGVPVVPGIHGSDQSAEELGREADKIGYPILIKAVAGGGGKGMRKVERMQNFASELAACQRESQNAFGDDVVLLEKFIENPRHIEIQIFGDAHGNYVHLFERDCSLQRRHQKVIEEAPAPGMTKALRKRMGEAAVTAARAVGYHGAGKVEFIVPSSQELNNETPFYFMEMNTRLQVEHPVTEAITGLDLVEWQLRVAAGEALPKKQSDLSISGHSIEVRLYAEDPAVGFLPSPGKIHALKWPELSNDGLRIDTGVAAGGEVSRFYDPMIAKLIVKANSRDCAIERMAQALKQTAVLGVKTNAGFLTDLVMHPGFAQGGVDTGFIDAHMTELSSSQRTTHTDAVAIAARLAWMKNHSPSADISNDVYSPFGLASGWQLGGARTSAVEVEIEGNRVSAQVKMSEPDSYEVSIAGESVSISTVDCRNLLNASACVDGILTGLSLAPEGDNLLVYVNGTHLSIRAYDFLTRRDAESGGDAVVRAPMTGKLQRLFVNIGDAVAKGDRLAVLEAMKMEHPLTAGISGVVKEVRASEGDQVNDGDIVIVLEAEVIEI
jgi:3-methylcrotonyl-CoA carboxylase alpha subunit